MGYFEVGDYIEVLCHTVESRAINHVYGGDTRYSRKVILHSRSAGSGGPGRERGRKRKA